MADIGGSLGGLLQGFNQTYWPAMRQNEAMALQKAQEDRAKAMQDFQMQKYAESEAKDRQAAGLYAGMLGIKPTTMTPRTEDEIYADANAAGDFIGVPTTTEQANPQYEQFLAGGAKAGADMVKMTREQQLAELKARQDLWKERVAQQNADNQAKRLDAILAKSQGGGNGIGFGKTAQERITGIIVDVDMADARGLPVDPKMRALADMYRDNPTINPGGTLTRGARSSIQKAQDEAEELKKNMSLAAAMHKDEFSTTGGALTAEFENQMGRTFGLPSSQKTNDMNTWKALTEQNFQAYRKWATGVAASEKELRWLLEGFPNSKDGPDQYRAKMKAVQTKIDGTLAQKAKALGQAGGAPIGGGMVPQPTQQRVRVFNPQTGRLE